MRIVVVENITKEVQRLYSKDRVITDINTFKNMKSYYEKMTKSEELKIEYMQDGQVHMIQLMTYPDKNINMVAGLFWHRKDKKLTYIMLNDTLWLVRLRKDKPIAFVEADGEMKSNLNKFRSLLGKEIKSVVDYVFEFIALILGMSKEEIEYVKRYIVTLK